jgi:hypothetical protein
VNAPTSFKLGGHIKSDATLAGSPDRLQPRHAGDRREKMNRPFIPEVTQRKRSRTWDVEINGIPVATILQNGQTFAAYHAHNNRYIPTRMTLRSLEAAMSYVEGFFYARHEAEEWQ